MNFGTHEAPSDYHFWWKYGKFENLSSILFADHINFKLMRTMKNFI